MSLSRKKMNNAQIHKVQIQLHLEPINLRQWKYICRDVLLENQVRQLRPLNRNNVFYVLLAKEVKKEF